MAQDPRRCPHPLGKPDGVVLAPFEHSTQQRFAGTGSQGVAVVRGSISRGRRGKQEQQDA
jgi:hypothetical protein